MALLVNGEYISDAAIREESKAVRQRLEQEVPDESGPEVEAEVREWAQENLVEQALLRQAARGFTEAQGEKSDTHDAGAEWRLSAFIDHLAKNVPRPQRREVSEYYRKNQILFLTPECAHASQIFKRVDEQVSEAEAQAGIQAAEAALRGGRSFGEVANEYSDVPGEGGNLGWVVRCQMGEEFDAVVFALKPGQVSFAFRSQAGFHLLKLHERKKAGVLPLRDVYSLAEELMMKRRRDEAIEKFISDVRAKSEVRRVSGASPEAIS